MLEFAHTVYEIVIWIFLLYSLGVFLISAWVGYYAYGAVLRYKHDNIFTDYSLLASNTNAPKFSLIAPAYNEGVTIVENVRSLLSLYYHNIEIIIVNDGSTDDSMSQLIKAYSLESISYFIQGNIETKEVKAVYRSTNPAFKKLIVVDKKNGGKADALNVGVNISSGEYIVCIDVDCILEQDSILKLAKPFLEQTDKRVIACGGAIRLANNCKVENGKVTEVSLPRSWLGRSQALEYIRAFVLGRMAWSRASGLILISGAFGAFDKQIVLACGGYDNKTVGEDMELVVRMRRYMEEQRFAYEVVNIPEPLCWTEVPESKEILKKQRNRWMRGTMETLWKHRKLMFNPKYNRLGTVSLPYWFFFEFLGPIVEFLGYFIFLLFLVLGIVNWSFFMALFALVISSGILYSIYAILVDLLGHQVYTKRKDLSKLIATAILEPFYFHPIVVRAGVSGAIDYFRKKKSWGEMTRQGFQQVTGDGSWIKWVGFQLVVGLRTLAPMALIFLVYFLVSVGVEWYWYTNNFAQLEDVSIGKDLFIDNLEMGLQLVAGLGIFYLLFSFVSRDVAKNILVFCFSFIVLIQFALFLYFTESRNLLGADAFYYSLFEAIHILSTSGMLSYPNIALFIVLLLLIIIPIWISSKRYIENIYIGIGLLLVGLLSFFTPSYSRPDVSVAGGEFVHNASVSKWRYFLTSNVSNYLEEHPELMLYGNKSSLVEDNSTDEYPFLRNEDTKDYLGSYFELAPEAPNLVFIIVEGLGYAYSSTTGYVGNFTPFIDSLVQKSLYWPNTLSTSGRTFSALPSLMGSLPFAAHGFLEQESLPKHFNLFNILKHNGFQTGFFYGGNSEFDQMKKFLQYSGVERLIDQEAFAEPYKMLPSSGGESWGYDDQSVFGKVVEIQNSKNQPYFNVVLTLSTHSPFQINNAAYYERLFDKHLETTKLTEANKKWAVSNRKQLVSVLNLDDALKQFFKAYEQRADYKNTLFVITGDHAMPEIPLESKIDRYHVPLIIYSPLLKSARSFKHTVSHFDVAPSLLAYYRTNYHLNTPNEVTWIGRGLAEGPSNKTKGMAMMQSKNQLIDYVYGNFHLVEGKLYKMDGQLREAPYVDESIKTLLSQRFEVFKKENRKFYLSNKMLPDSVYEAFFNIKAISKP